MFLNLEVFVYKNPEGFFFLGGVICRNSATVTSDLMGFPGRLHTTMEILFILHSKDG